MINTIFIDFAYTLSASRYWDQLVNQKPEVYLKIDNWFVTKKGQRLLAELNRGKINCQQFCQFLAEDLSIEPHYLYEELIVSCRKMTFINPHIPFHLQELKKSGFRLILATDHIEFMRSDILDSLGLSHLFDDLIISSEIGFLKMDGGDCDMFFSDYMQKNNQIASSVILVDDNKKIINKYRKLGFRTFQITPETDFVYFAKEMLREDKREAI